MATRNNTLLLKRSNVPGKVPTTLSLGELALNTSDVKLYASGTTDNEIKQIGWDRVSNTGDTMSGDYILGPLNGSNPTFTYNGISGGTISLEIQDDGELNWIGSSGVLFSISDSLVGTLMSVNDVSGLPILQVESDDRVIMGKFGDYGLVVDTDQVFVSTDTVTTTAKLYVSGDTYFDGSISIVDGTQQTGYVLTSDASGNASWADIDSIGSVSADTYVESGSYSNRDITFTYNTGGTFTVLGVDNYVSGASMNGNTLELSRTGGLSDVTVDLSQFLDDTDNYVSGASMNGNTLELSRTGGLSDVTVDLSQFLDDTDNYVTGGTYDSSNLEIDFTGTNGATTFSTSLGFLTNLTNQTIPIWSSSTGTFENSSITQDGSGIVYIDNGLSASTTMLSVTGGIEGESKSFSIPHQGKPGKLLKHGSLEGPEHGVYIRGKQLNNKTIKLPDYWSWLVDYNTITVQLTPVGKPQSLYVVDINENDNTITVGGNDYIEFFYFVQGERKDIDKLKIEQDVK